MHFFLRVFVDSWDVFLRGFWIFLVLSVSATVIASGPNLLLRSYGEGNIDLQGQLAFVLILIVSFFPFFVFFVFLSVATQAALQILVQRGATFSKCLRRGALQTMRVCRVAVPAAILIFLAMALVLCAMLIPSLFGEPVLSLVLPFLVVAMRYVIFSIAWFPVIPVVAVLWVAVPVAMVEQLGGFASISRSAALTKGVRLSICAVAATASVVVFLLLVSETFIRIYSESAIVALAGSYFRWLVIVIVWIAAAVVPAVTYYTLRSEKDGGDIEQIAAVFD